MTKSMLTYLCKEVRPGRWRVVAWRGDVYLGGVELRADDEADARARAERLLAGIGVRMMGCADVSSEPLMRVSALPAALTARDLTVAVQAAVAEMARRVAEAHWSYHRGVVRSAARFVELVGACVEVALRPLKVAVRRDARAVRWLIDWGREVSQALVAVLAPYVVAAVDLVDIVAGAEWITMAVYTVLLPFADAWGLPASAVWAVAVGVYRLLVTLARRAGRPRPDPQEPEDRPRRGSPPRSVVPPEEPIKPLPPRKPVWTPPSGGTPPRRRVVAPPGQLPLLGSLR